MSTISATLRTLRLDRTFDAVFVHDAVCYMTTERELLDALETAWVHCRPGGAALFAPDYVRERFRPGSDEGGHDEVLPEGLGGCPRGLRFLEWVWDPDPNDSQYVADYAYLLRERDGLVSVVHDRHHEGLFSRDRWQALMAQVGFVPRSVLITHTDWEPGVTEVCRRTATLLKRHRRSDRPGKTRTARLAAAEWAIRGPGQWPRGFGA